MKVQDIERIVVAGAGTMGYSMAQIFARYGYQVTIYDLAQAALDNAATRIAQGTDNLVADGDITRDEGDELLHIPARKIALAPATSWSRASWSASM